MPRWFAPQFSGVAAGGGRSFSSEISAGAGCRALAHDVLRRRGLRFSAATRVVTLGTVLLLACGEGGGSPPDAGGDTGAAPDGALPDGGGADSPPGSACSQSVGGPIGGVHVLRFQQAAPATRVHLRRRYVRSGAGESAIYELAGMWIEREGGCLAITDSAALGYTNSHHNWRDRATGTADGVQYLVVMDKEIATQTWTLQLTGTSAGGTGGAAFAPVALTATGGPIGLIEVPTSLPVRVSELMPVNGTGWKDDAGEVEPWIELWNPSAEAVDVSGWSLSDDPGQPRRWTLPAGTVIGRHQYLVIAADGEPTEGPLHASFRLAAGGGQLLLTNAAGVTAGERAYAATPADRSLRFSSTIDGFEPAPTVTVGADDF